MPLRLAWLAKSGCALYSMASAIEGMYIPSVGPIYVIVNKRKEALSIVGWCG